MELQQVKAWIQIFQESADQPQEKLLWTQFPTANDERIDLLAKTIKPQRPELTFVVPEKNSSFYHQPFCY